jgi:predicted NBD/HSP70 family sugar kinase
MVGGQRVDRFPAANRPRFIGVPEGTSAMDNLAAGNPTSQLIVETIESVGELSRAGVAQRLGLPISTVNAHVRTLLRRQALGERDQGSSGRKGRTSSLLYSTADPAVVAVLSLQHGTGIAQGPVQPALVDVNGSIICSALADPTDRPIAAGLRLLGHGLAAHPAAARGLVCAVLSVPLPLQSTNPGHQQVARQMSVIPPLAGILGPAPHMDLAAGLGVPALLRNDADLGALGEARWGAGRGDCDLVYLKLINGLGMGIVRGGQLLTGDVTPGEIAHIRVPGGTDRCPCGSVGCLWTIWAGRHGLAGMLSSTGVACSDFEDVRAAAAGSDQTVLTALRAIGEQIGRALAVSFFVFQPTRMVLEAGLGAAFAPLARGIGTALAGAQPSWAVHRFGIVPGELAGRAEVLGAVCAARDFLAELQAARQ